MFKKKLKFIRLKNDNLNYKEIIFLLNISKSTYYRWNNDYKLNLSLFYKYYL